MPPARVLVERRTSSLLLALVAGLLLTAGLQPTRAAAAPPTVAPASPSTSSAASTTGPDGPTAVDDVLHLQATGYWNPNVVPYLADDRWGAASPNLAATSFPDDQPGGHAPAADHRSVTFAGLGILSMTPGEFPHMEFDSLGGPGTAVARYRLVDDAGLTSDALVTVVVGPGGSSSVAFEQGRPASVDVLAGDIPGLNADGTPGSFDLTSVHFTTSSGGYGSTVSTDGRTLTDPVRGVFRADPTTGVVTIHPAKSYQGGPDEHITYVARDTTRAADGTVEHHSYRAHLDLVVTPVGPVVVEDVVPSTPHHASVAMPGVTDDLPGAPSVPLRPELTVFITSGYHLPDGSHLYDHGHGLKVAGEGWWTLDAAGRITFSPMAGFAYETQQVQYQVTDANGSTARGHEEAWVFLGPQARRDVATTAQHVPVDVVVLKNDVPGGSAGDQAGSMDPTSVHFPAVGQPAGATTSVYGRVLSVPHEGVYTADRLTGVVTFDPEPAFVGKAAPVTYSTWDTVRRYDGRVLHNATTGTLDVQVTAAAQRAASSGPDHDTTDRRRPAVR